MLKHSHTNLRIKDWPKISSLNLPDISPKSRNRFLTILTLLLLQLLLAEGVYAATQAGLERGNAYAIAGLLILVMGLGIYLMVVIIEPERF
ncbi:potassium-transporting ATPase subunit F [Synechococcus sp. PCC 6312]|uniref:potassium-transporting ATPase subunit F n=1 Tax=Synechococcus sp. (strain ATCC 27167 / PCC 6312) TaxID=195253 RepID=UPI00029F23F7|nr:potassium-transporting ATPase subunit F [Synechococcus sp. PCC 6312]AFY61812.1 F subunit of K+-transporting ATPase (Potass_KdpF) [Synechococcus sp. PCC 6312]